MGCVRSVNKPAQSRQIEMSADAHNRSIVISLTWINSSLGGGSIILRFHGRCGCKPALTLTHITAPKPTLVLRSVRFSNGYKKPIPIGEWVFRLCRLHTFTMMCRNYDSC